MQSIYLANNQEKDDELKKFGEHTENPKTPMSVDNAYVVPIRRF